MTTGREGYEVSFNQAMSFWYIVHSQMKGSVLHRNILSEHYESQEDAERAVASMRSA